jgi:hypothetical protein
MLRKLKFVVAGLIIIFANQAVGYAVHAAMPDTALAAGTTRYYIVSTTTAWGTTKTTWDLVPDTITINIPSGKHGDVMILYCASSTASGKSYVRATIAGTPAVPSSVLFAEVPGYGAHCAHYYRLGLAAGYKGIVLQAHTSAGGSMVLGERTLLVTVNIR